MSQVRDIVVIGASLGGVTAIAKLALAWPAHLPAAVIVALTVPGQPAQSVLQVLEGYAPVQVAYASEGEAVRLRRIYLSPPNKHLFIGPDGLLNLDSGNAFDATRPSIDRLFTSAAPVVSHIPAPYDLEASKCARMPILETDQYDNLFNKANTRTDLT